MTILKAIHTWSSSDATEPAYLECLYLQAKWRGTKSFSPFRFTSEKCQTTHDRHIFTQITKDGNNVIILCQLIQKLPSQNEELYNSDISGKYKTALGSCHNPEQTELDHK